MTNEQKQQVKEALSRYAARYNTQAEAAASLQGISRNMVSQVKNGAWELLSERTWHQLARQVGFYCGEWIPADTSASLLLRILFADAMQYNMCYGIAVSAGLGKTFTASHYTRENNNVLYLAGHEDYNRRFFLIDLLAAAGLQPARTMPLMMESLAADLAARPDSLLLIDDADKLKDRVLHLIVLLANRLTGICGVIVMGGAGLYRRITEGVRLKKAGYDEVYRNFGKRIITLTNLAAGDTGLVCRANGLHDEELITLITEECNGSLHPVAGLLQQYSSMRIAA